MPRISIIMACHNAEQFVGEAIESVLSQTFADFELIFIDDYSIDQSLAIARSVAKGDVRVKIHANIQNIGASATRNLALGLATGEWLAVLDADDVFMPTKLEKQIAAIDNGDPRLVLLGTGCHIIDRDNKIQSSHLYPTSSAVLKNRLIGHVPFPPHSSLMYRASTVKALHGFNVRFSHAEDLDLWLRLRNHGTFACLKEPLIKYRIHENNASSFAERKGYIHLDYATAASVCELLRNQGLPDPSNSNDEIIWNNFLAYISEQVKRSKMIEYRDWKKSWRSAEFVCKPKSVQYLSVLKQALIHPSKMWRLLREHIDGNQVASISFKNWVRKSL
ncbi:glycosyltransferase family 2 protein [Zwartia sp.]|uniref:glycosyltransferase family 2 protein n=1 Tax=Zwartia sp. TaxID=2978004 RepID=UPI003BAF5AEF